MKNNTPFIWNAEADEAFNTLKQLLTSQPLLQYPDFSKPFNLTCDASNEALGVVLSQGEIGRDLPVVVMPICEGADLPPILTQIDTMGYN